MPQPDECIDLRALAAQGVGGQAVDLPAKSRRGVISHDLLTGPVRPQQLDNGHQRAGYLFEPSGDFVHQALQRLRHRGIVGSFEWEQ